MVAVGASGQGGDLVSVGRHVHTGVVVHVVDVVVVVARGGTVVANVAASGGIVLGNGRSVGHLLLLLLLFFATQAQRKSKILRKFPHDLAGGDETTESFLMSKRIAGPEGPPSSPSRRSPQNVTALPGPQLSKPLFGANLIG